MIKPNKKNILIVLIFSIIILVGSVFLFLLFQEKSSLISYSDNKKEVRVNIFDKLSKKNIKQIYLSSNDPKNFVLNRSINENTDVLFTYNKEKKKVDISTIDDEIQINGQTQSGLGLLLKEIDANIGDTLTFGSNTLDVTENLKSVFKIKDFIDGLKLQQNANSDNEKNLLENQNYSFENGLWSKTVDVCAKQNDNNSVVSQSLSNDCTDGKQCLLISSKNNTGCVSNFFTVELKKDYNYKISFDYKQTVENSASSILFILIGKDGQNYYFTSNLSSTDYFKSFVYNFNTTQDIAGVIVKFNVTGDNGKESSVIFDNLKITSNSTNRTIEIKKDDIIKDHLLYEVGLKNDLNEFKAIPKTDSEMSSNDFDYFLTFENKYQNSYFIKRIDIQEKIFRSSKYFIVVSSLITIMSLVYLLKELIVKYFEIIIFGLLLSFKKILYFFKILLNYPSKKINEIKNEKPLFIILKILTFVIIFGFYLYNSLSNKKEINILSAIALFYGINSVLFVIESRVSAFFALIYLALCPVLLIMKKDAVAENMAVQAYYFLVITVITQIRENRKEENKN